jgi:hypothetical protein
MAPRSKAHKRSKTHITSTQSTQLAVSPSVPSFLTKKVKTVLPLVAIVVLPVLVNGRLFIEVWRGAESRGWDGTGHYAVAQIYDQTIFPNTLGWTDAYFGGMPFPNFYPPIFYWLVALLHRTHLFSFAASFRIVLVLPVLLIPAAIWLLSWSLSDGSRVVATAAALASTLLLANVRFMGSLLAGLDYFSTFQIGLYTQPLGFVLMIAWFVSYASPISFSLSRSSATTPDHGRQAKAYRTSGRLVLSTLLLALTVLSNFFNAITAVVLIFATVASDVVYLRRAADLEQRHKERKVLAVHIFSPIVALLLTLFWLVPMIAEYKYFVTRPYAPETQSLFSWWLLAWYAVALLGGILRLRQSRKGVPVRAMGVYLGACLVLALAIVFSATIAPSWFPLQAPRFMATLTFLLTVPVGFAITTAFRYLARLFGEVSGDNLEFGFRRARYTSAVALVLFLALVLTAPSLSWAYAFYQAGKRGPIDELLDFARQHRDGRYLVEVINPKLGPAWTEASFDARAINSYLGSQGNETISGVFHEASPNALFTLPVVNTFSNYPDSFGVSSVLADDLDFAAQPLSEQVKRAQFLGVKYLIIRTPAMKERVSKEVTSVSRHDLGWWAVFELPGSPAAKIQALPYKPALVLSSFTVKARRRNEMSFIRLAEEQFAYNWFDVLAVRSPESKIDRLTDLEEFGALIINTYDYTDESAAFERLRTFGQDHALICLSAGDSLFRRIQNARADFPLLEIIERQPEAPGETVDALKPSDHYNSTTIRQQWKKIRAILEQNKIPTNIAPSDVTGTIDQNSIKLTLNSTGNSGSVPVVIANTFHPNWQRRDGGLIYAATPFNMLTFVDQSAVISYGRRWFDKLGLWASAGTLLLLGLFTAWHRLQSRGPSV